MLFSSQVKGKLLLKTLASHGSRLVCLEEAEDQRHMSFARFCYLLSLSQASSSPTHYHNSLTFQRVSALLERTQTSGRVVPSSGSATFYFHQCTCSHLPNGNLLDCDSTGRYEGTHFRSSHHTETTRTLALPYGRCGLPFTLRGIVGLTFSVISDSSHL